MILIYFKIASITVFREATSAELQQEIEEEFGVRFHTSTIRQHRRKLGYEAVVPRSVPFIRENNKVKRLEFCIRLLQNKDDFDNVIFTDESSVQVGANKRIVIAKVIRDSNGKIIYSDSPTCGKLKHPLKVHVWGGISRHGATQIHIFNGNMDAKYYVNSILRDTLLPGIHHLYPPPLTHS